MAAVLGELGRGHHSLQVSGQPVWEAGTNHRMESLWARPLLTCHWCLLVDRKPRRRDEMIRQLENILPSRCWW